jgi:hypothetical protein
MPVQLSPDKHDQIFRTIQGAFSDFTLFDKLVSKQLRKLIADTNNVEIDQKTARKVTERYFDTDQFQTEQQKLLLAQIQIILKTTYVLVLSYSPEFEASKYHSIGEFLQHYPEFDKEDSEELHYLLNFRNYLKIALQIVPARLNKQLLVKIAARLEGSGNEYITGGGQKPAVTRRCQIYEKEGNVSKINKPKSKDKIATSVAQQQAQIFGGNNPLQQPSQQQKQAKKRPNTHAALRDVKMIRLPSEEVRRLAQGPLDPFGRSSTHQPIGGDQQRQDPHYNHDVEEEEEEQEGHHYNNPHHHAAKKTKTGFSGSLNHLTSENSMGTSSSHHSRGSGSYSTHNSQQLVAGIPIPQHQHHQHHLSSSSSIPVNNSDLQQGISMGYLLSSESILNNALEVIGSVDELLELELCKSDTVIDNLPQPPLYQHQFHHNQQQQPQHNQSIVVSHGNGFSGSLGPITVQPSFPPPLLRQHSDLLDRLLSDGNPMWTEIVPNDGQENENAMNSLSAYQQNNQPEEQQQEAMINVALDEAALSGPVQMIRSVSWDVYNGSYTEDLMQYLQDTPLN